jgi:serine/threonine-protein kinase
MSPEQAAGTHVDHRTDIYALGVILYEMASGHVPFDADNFMGILTQHMYKAPVPILALVPAPQIPPGLDAIIQKCLTKKVQGRYETMNELITDLEKVEQGEHPAALAEMMARSGAFPIPGDYFRPSAMPTPLPATPPSSRRRSRAPLFIAMGAVATIGIAALAVSLARTGTSSAQNSVPSSARAQSTQPLPGSTGSAAASASSTVPADQPKLVSVTLAVSPVTAKVVVDGATTNLNLPSSGVAANGMVELKVDPSSPMLLDVSAPGYAPAQVRADGKSSSLRVELVAQQLRKATGTPSSSRPRGTHKCKPGDELCNPFD